MRRGGGERVADEGGSVWILYSCLFELTVSTFWESFLYIYMYTFVCTSVRHGNANSIRWWWWWCKILAYKNTPEMNVLYCLLGMRTLMQTERTLYYFNIYTGETNVYLHMYICIYIYIVYDVSLILYECDCHWKFIESVTIFGVHCCA